MVQISKMMSDLLDVRAKVLFYAIFSIFRLDINCFEVASFALAQAFTPPKGGPFDYRNLGHTTHSFGYHATSRWFFKPILEGSHKGTFFSGEKTPAQDFWNFPSEQRGSCPNAFVAVRYQPFWSHHDSGVTTDLALSTRGTPFQVKVEENASIFGGFDPHTKTGNPEDRWRWYLQKLAQTRGLRTSLK